MKEKKQQKKKKALAITVEFVLVVLLCLALLGVCLSAVTDNFSKVFEGGRNYKKLFERRME